MQFRSSRIRFLIANLNIAVQWCFWEYIDITALNIPQIRITAVSQWTARFNIQRKPKKYWCLLGNLSFGLFDHKKKFQDFSRTFWKVQFPRLSRTLFKFQNFPVGIMSLLVKGKKMKKTTRNNDQNAQISAIFGIFRQI